MPDQFAQRLLPARLNADVGNRKRTEAAEGRIAMHEKGAQRPSLEEAPQLILPVRVLQVTPPQKLRAPVLANAARGEERIDLFEIGFTNGPDRIGVVFDVVAAFHDTTPETQT